MYLTLQEEITYVCELWTGLETESVNRKLQLLKLHLKSNCRNSVACNKFRSVEIYGQPSYVPWLIGMNEIGFVSNDY